MFKPIPLLFLTIDRDRVKVGRSMVSNGVGLMLKIEIDLYSGCDILACRIDLVPNPKVIYNNLQLQ